MRRWITIAARLYPRHWRRRYGAEFDALAESVEPDWRELVNVLGGALKMQMKNTLMLATCMAVLGALAALGVSSRLPERYVSTAVLRVTPADDLQIRQAIWKQRHVSARNIRVQSLSNGTFEISFTHSDPARARAVTEQLVAAAVAENAGVKRFRESAWRDMSWAGAPPTSNMEVIAGASDPRKSAGPNRPLVAAGGILLGLIVAAAYCRPKIALQVGAFAAAGCIVGAVASLLIPPRYTSTAELRFTPPLNPSIWYAPSPPERLPSHLRRLQEQAVVKLASDLLGPDLRIQTISATSFRISCTTRDARTAQSVVRQLVTAFVVSEVTEQRHFALMQGGEIRDMADHRIGENLMLMESASLPETPDGPGRLAIVAAGLGAGMLLGALALVVHRPRGPSPRSAVPVLAV